jgi:hypothetical protein
MSSNKFWEIDDILMSNEQIICITEADIHGLEFLDKSNNQTENDHIIKEENKLEIPLWLSLILRSLNYVSIKHPKYLTDKFYNLIQADPIILNFKVKNQYFYDICTQLIPYLDEDLKWPKVLADAMYKRFLYLLQNSSNVLYENHSLIKNLCLKEKDFYEKNVKINRNVKFYIENYFNNNKTLDDVLEAKKMTHKRKKIN